MEPKYKVKICWCGAVFRPQNSAQKHCCPRHQRIKNTARMSKYGTELIREDPAAALRWYSHIT